MRGVDGEWRIENGDSEGIWQERWKRDREAEIKMGNRYRKEDAD